MRRTTKPPPPPRGCVGCGQARGDVRQAIVARSAGPGVTLWLCADCAERDAAVLDFVAAYRALHGGRAAREPAAGGEGMANEPGGAPTLATYVRARRTALGLSQLALAMAARVSLTAVCDLETGRVRRPHRATLDRLAAALRVSPGTLDRLPRDDSG